MSSSNNNDPNSNNDNSNNAARSAAQLEEEENQAKRAAMAGQWRTPPLPVFATTRAVNNAPPAVAPAGAPPAPPAPAVAPDTTTCTTSTSTNSTSMNVPSVQVVNQLPDSTEDYAKALQEAYRRGAQAAAAMAAQAASGGGVVGAQQQQQQQQQQLLSAAVSCPDLQQSKPPAAAAAQAVQQQEPGFSLPDDTTTVAAAAAANVPNPLGMDTDPLPMTSMVSEPGMDIPSMMQHDASQSAAMMQMPPPTSQPLAATPQFLQQSQVHHASGETSTMDSYNHTATATAGPPPPTMHVMPMQSQQSQQQQQQQAAAVTNTMRSMSLPDMTTYAAAQEEDKRQKRLARNRASARLRRLRKKNLVDAYETEVGILEKTLQQLQAHEWGANDNASALTEALSMDRGQQVLDRASRQQAATAILNQQLQLMEQLQEMMQEQYVLHQLAAAEGGADFQDLKESLQLTDEQLRQLSLQQSGWAEEWAALQTIKGSLQAMKENDWLSNEGCSNAAETFLAILHKNQVSKFLLWSDHNAEAIDELDSVNAASQVPAGPVFGFGVESTPGGLGGEE